MDFNELQDKLGGLSEAQLKLLLQVAVGELPADKQELVVKLADAMVKVNKG
ncbi:hypothetical protein ES703_29868 [subsurface metagenome]